MMRPLMFAVAVLFCVFGNLRSQGLDRFSESYLQEFDPQGYSYYQYGEGVKSQGRRIAEGLTNQLERYSSLVETTDPGELMRDFDSKLQNIEALEADLNRQSEDFFLQQSDQLGNQLKSKDYMGAFANIMSSIDAGFEMDEAEAKLARQKAELERQKRAKMNAIMQKRYDYARRMARQSRQRAAYAEAQVEEKYHLASADYFWCAASSGYCNKPQKPMSTGIENKFIARDIQLKKVAERKYETYMSNADIGYGYFLDGAISFAAAAATNNQSSENYAYLAELYGKKSGILGFASILTAQSLDPAYISSEKQDLFDRLKQQATDEIDRALRENNQQYLNSFLDAGLDRTIQIEGRSLLAQAIHIDQPDAVQLILNRYIDGLSQKQINTKIQQTIMLCAAQNSPNTIKRFVELGVQTDFTLYEKAPADVAAASLSPDALEVLIENSSRKNALRTKYATAPVMIIATAKTDPVKAGQLIDQMTSPGDIKLVVGRLIVMKRAFAAESADLSKRGADLQKMLQDAKRTGVLPENASIEERATFLENALAKLGYMNGAILSLASSAKAGALIRSDASMQMLMRDWFVEEVQKSGTMSASGKMIRSGLVQLDRPMTLRELKGSTANVRASDPYPLEQKIQWLLRGVEAIPAVPAIQKEKVNQIIRAYRRFAQNPSGLTADEKRVVEYQFNLYLLAGSAPEFMGGIPGSAKEQLEYKKYLLSKPLQMGPTLSKQAQSLMKVAAIEEESKILGYDDSYMIGFAKNGAYNQTWRLFAAALFLNKPIDARIAVEVGTRVDGLPSKAADNLAVIATLNGNSDLFAELDTRFDLSQAKNTDGSSVLHALAQSDVVFYQGVFASKDYDIDQKINGRSIFDLQVEKLFEKFQLLDTASFGELMRQLYLAGGRQMDARVSLSGGTLLHLEIDHFVEAMKASEGYSSQIEKLLALRIDPTTKDSQGRTALEYLEAHAGEYIDKYEPKLRFDTDSEFYENLYDRIEEQLEEYAEKF